MTNYCYNVNVVPVSKCKVPKVFLLPQNGTRKGRSAVYFCNPWITLHSWINQSVPFGFFI